MDDDPYTEVEPEMTVIIVVALVLAGLTVVGRLARVTAVLRAESAVAGHRKAVVAACVVVALGFAVLALVARSDARDRGKDVEFGFPFDVACAYDFSMPQCNTKEYLADEARSKRLERAERQDYNREHALWLLALITALYPLWRGGVSVWTRPGFRQPRAEPALTGAPGKDVERDEPHVTEGVAPVPPDLVVPNAPHPQGDPTVDLSAPTEMTVVPALPRARRRGRIVAVVTVVAVLGAGSVVVAYWRHNLRDQVTTNTSATPPTPSSTASAQPLPAVTSDPAPWAVSAVPGAGAVSPSVLSAWRLSHRAAGFPCDLYFPIDIPRAGTPDVNYGGSDGVVHFGAYYQHIDVQVWPPESLNDVAPSFQHRVAYTWSDGTQEHAAKERTGVFSDVLLSIPNERCFYEISATDHVDFDNALTSFRKITVAGRRP